MNTIVFITGCTHTKCDSATALATHTHTPKDGHTQNTRMTSTYYESKCFTLENEVIVSPSEGGGPLSVLDL